MSPTPDESTVNHLDWRLTELERQMRERFDVIDRRFDKLGVSIDSLAYVNKELYHSEQSAQDKRMNDIEGRQQWTLGLLISAILTALIAGLIRLAVG